MDYLKVESISKFFNSKSNRQVLDNISFSVDQNTLTAVFGPNGCGKTTLFSIIAKLISPDSGNITIKNGSTKKPEISYIFQNYADTLLPKNTCLDNIAFPLELKGIGKEERREAARKLVSELDIDIPLELFPYQCSGGQKQLTAIARALIVKPDLFLLDEPFSALDYSARTAMESKFLEIWTKKKTTTLIVSHDVDEAVYLSDKVIVLSKIPTKIVDTIEIDLPRPRRIEDMQSERFFQIRNHVVDAFQRGQKNDT